MRSLLFVLLATTLTLGARVYKDKKSFHGYHALSNIAGFYPDHTDHCLPKGHHHVRTFHHRTPEGKSVKLHYNVSFHPKFTFAVIDGPIHSMICGKNQKHVLVRFENPEGASVFLKELAVANVVSSFPPHQCQDSNVVSMLLRRFDLHSDNITVVIYGGAITPFDVLSTAHVEFETDLLHGTIIPFAHGDPEFKNKSTTQHHNSFQAQGIALPIENMNTKVTEWGKDPFGVAKQNRDALFQAEMKAMKEALDKRDKIFEMVDAMPKKSVNSYFNYDPWFNFDIKYQWQPTSPTDFQASLAKLDANKKSWERDSLSKAMEAGIWEWNVDIIGDQKNKGAEVLKAPYQKEATEAVNTFLNDILGYFGLKGVESALNLYTRVKLQPKVNFALIYDADDKTPDKPKLKKFELWMTFFYVARLFLDIKFQKKSKVGDIFTLFELAPICIPIPLGPVSLSLCPKAAVKLEWSMDLEIELSKKYSWGLHGFKKFGWDDDQKLQNLASVVTSEDSYMMNIPLGYEAYLGDPAKCTAAQVPFLGSQGNVPKELSRVKSVEECARLCHNPDANTEYEKCKGFAFNRVEQTGMNCVISEYSGGECNVAAGPGVNAIATIGLQGTQKLIVGSGNGQLRVIDPAGLSAPIVVTPTSGEKRMVKAIVTYGTGKATVAVVGWDAFIRFFEYQDTKPTPKLVENKMLRKVGTCAKLSFDDMETECKKVDVCTSGTCSTPPPNKFDISDGVPRCRCSHVNCPNDYYIPPFDCSNYVPPFTSLSTVENEGIQYLFAGDSGGNIWMTSLYAKSANVESELMYVLKLDPPQMVYGIGSSCFLKDYIIVVATESGLTYSRHHNFVMLTKTYRLSKVNDAKARSARSVTTYTADPSEMFSQSRLYVVSGHADGTIWLWYFGELSLERQRETLFKGTSSGLFAAHDDSVSSIACVTYQKSWIVVSGAQDASLNIWSMKEKVFSGSKQYWEPTLLNTYQKHSGDITGISLNIIPRASSDSLSISTVSSDGHVISFEDTPKSPTLQLTLEVPTSAAKITDFNYLRSFDRTGAFLILNGGTEFMIPYGNFLFNVKRNAAKFEPSTTNCLLAGTYCTYIPNYFDIARDLVKSISLGTIEPAQTLAILQQSATQDPANKYKITETTEKCTVKAFDLSKIWTAGSKPIDYSSQFSVTGEKCTFVSVSPDGRYVTLAAGNKIRIAEMVADASNNNIRKMQKRGKISTGEVWEPILISDVVNCGGFGLRRKTKTTENYYVLIGTADQKLRIVDVLETPSKTIAEITVDGPVALCSFSPDGRYVGAITTKGTLIWWDAVSTNAKSWISVPVLPVFKTLATKEPVIKSLSISPDNSVIAIAVNGYVTTRTSTTSTYTENEGQVHIWNLETQQVIYSYKLASTEGVEFVTFSPDGKWLAATGTTATTGTQQGQTSADIKPDVFKIYQWDSYGYVDMEINTPAALTGNYVYGDLGVGAATQYVFFDKQKKYPWEFEVQPPWEARVNVKTSIALIFEFFMSIGVADPTGNILGIDFGGPKLSLVFTLVLEGSINGVPSKGENPTTDLAKERFKVDDASANAALGKSVDTLVISIYLQVQVQFGVAISIAMRIFGYSIKLYEAPPNLLPQLNLGQWGGPDDGLLLRVQALYQNNMRVCPWNMRYSLLDKKNYPVYETNSKRSVFYWPKDCKSEPSANLCVNNPSSKCGDPTPFSNKLRWKTISSTQKRDKMEVLQMNSTTDDKFPISSDTFTGVCDAEAFKYMYKLTFIDKTRANLEIMISLGPVSGLHLTDKYCGIQGMYRVKGKWGEGKIVEFVRVLNEVTDKDRCWMQPLPQVMQAKATDAGDNIGIWLSFPAVFCADIHLRYGITSVLEPGNTLLNEQTMQSVPAMAQLILHSDGNMAIYGYESDYVIWESGTAISGTNAVFSSLYVVQGMVILENVVGGVKSAKVLNPNAPEGGKFLAMVDCDLQLFPDSAIVTGRSLWNLTNKPCPTVSRSRSSPRWHRGGSYLYQGETILPNAGLMNGNGYFQHERGLLHFVRTKTQLSMWSITDESIRSVRTSALSLLWDGNLVLYDYEGKIVWESKTSGKGATILRLERCAIVLYKEYPNIGNVWSYGATDCPDTPDADPLVWPAAVSSYPTPMGQMEPGHNLGPGQALLSAFGMLYHQLDGNLVIISRDNTTMPTPVWSSNTAGRCTTSLMFQYDGSLVLYGCKGEVVWNAGLVNGNVRPKLIEFLDDCTLNALDSKVHSHAMTSTTISKVLNSQKCPQNVPVMALIDHAECWWVQTGFYLSRAQFVATLTFTTARW
eukprot:PhF_6_TR31551/c0_g1_i1/m.46587